MMLSENRREVARTLVASALQHPWGWSFGHIVRPGEKCDEGRTDFRTVGAGSGEQADQSPGGHLYRSPAASTAFTSLSLAANTTTRLSTNARNQARVLSDTSPAYFCSSGHSWARNIRPGAVPAGSIRMRLSRSVVTGLPTPLRRNGLPGRATLGRRASCSRAGVNDVSRRYSWSVGQASSLQDAQHRL